MSKAGDVFDAIKERNPQLLKELVDTHPGLAKARDANGVSALLVAQYHRLPEFVETLRAAAGELDLFEAAALGDVERLRLLVDGDRTLVRTWSPDGFSALHLAVFFGRIEAAALLVARGADVNLVAENPMAVAPLHSAAASGRADAVQLLLEAGAIPNVRQQGGWTALHAAVQHCNVEMIRMLLAHGADPDLRTDDGKSARDMVAGKPTLEALFSA